MIEHSIQNHPDVISMTNSNHFFKLFQRSHTGIDHKIIGCIIFVIGICHKYRIQIDAIDSKLSDILYILTDSLYGSSKSVSGYHAIPCFNRFRHFNNTAFFRGKAIRKYLIHNQILCPRRWTDNVLSADIRELKILCSVVAYLCTESSFIIILSLVAIFQCKVITQSWINIVKSGFIIVKQVIT